MNRNDDYIPFSQRNGLTPIPPQLKIGEVSSEMRLLIAYAITQEIYRETYYETSHSHFRTFRGDWGGLAFDLHVRFFKRRPSSFNGDVNSIKGDLEQFSLNYSFEKVFNLIEFFYRHSACSTQFKSDLANAFVEAKAAYRIIDGQIVAIGTEEQATAFVAALENSSAAGAAGARQHLIAAGVALRNGLWADSIRESIHAVESIAKTIEPSATTLGPALKALEKRGYIHPSLKAGFEKLYGYTNDESGIRHAILEAEVKVDETDALFMLGACASFVSYLIARSRG